MTTSVVGRLRGPSSLAPVHVHGPVFPARAAVMLDRGGATMSIERLTVDDEFMLWPDEVWPQDIGALAVLDGRTLFDPAGELRIGAVRDLVAERLHLVPRFRQLLRVPPRQLGGPLWVDAPAFDITQHVAARSLPSPADEAVLLRAVEQLRRQRLDRSRPLWEMWLLPGLPEDRIGLFVRMHHTIADGMAGIATVAAFLDRSSDVAHSPPPRWSPAPAPSEPDLRDDERRRRSRRRRQAFSGLMHPVATAHRAASVWPAMRELVAQRPGPATSLDRLVGSDRRLALIRSTLPTVTGIARAHGATVNDVLLTATAGGLRQLLLAREEPVAGVQLPIYVPVSLHRGPPAQARGNLIAQMVVPLPVGAADPVLRLRIIAEQTARRKATVRPPLAMVPHRGVAGRVFLRLVARQRVNLTSADLTGPDSPLHLAGAPVLEVFPLVQLIGTVTLAVGALSYAGRFGIMIVADGDTYPDLDLLVAGVEAELRALARRGSEPGRQPR